MKTTPILTFLAVVAGLLFASGALGLEQRGGMHTGEGLHTGEALIGTQVRGADGQNLGEITDVQVNGVEYAEVTAVTGVTYLVPVVAFEMDREGRYATLDADTDRLAAAPLRPHVAATDRQRDLHEEFGLAYPWADLPQGVHQEAPVIGLTPNLHEEFGLAYPWTDLPEGEPVIEEDIW